MQNERPLELTQTACGIAAHSAWLMTIPPYMSCHRIMSARADAAVSRIRMIIASDEAATLMSAALNSSFPMSIANSLLPHETKAWGALHCAVSFHDLGVRLPDI